MYRTATSHFKTRSIATNADEAVHVIDELLNHESQLINLLNEGPVSKCRSRLLNGSSCGGQPITEEAADARATDAAVTYCKQKLTCTAFYRT